MTNSAEKLVIKLKELGYIVHGSSFQLLIHRGQARMNKAAGEAAPTWELLVNPLYNTLNGKIVSNGSIPIISLPDGTELQTVVYGFQPLWHILKISSSLLDVNTDEEGRILIFATIMPDSWN